MKLKKFSQALTDCNLSIECDDTYAKSYLRRGNIKEELDDHENAVYDYQKVQELDPSKRNYYKYFTKLIYFSYLICLFDLLY